MRLFALTFALAGLLCASLCAASAIPTYPYARSLDTRDASPVVAARAAPSPSPSPSPHFSNDERIRVPKIPIRGRLQRRNTDEIILSPAELSGHLCPQPMSVCPITKFAQPVTLGQWVRDGYECVDMQEDLTSCGGCGILDKKHDCTSIDGARTVSCVVGTCQVDSCRSGYTLSLDGKNCVRTE